MTNTPLKREDYVKMLQSDFDTLSLANLPVETQSSFLEMMQHAKGLIAAFEETQIEVNQARQDKAKFVSVVTHELRLPLTSIKGYTDLLRQGIVGPVNEQQTNFLNVIKSNVDRMSTLISDLADMSHIQSGRLKLQPKLYELERHWVDFINIWRPKFEQKNQALQVEIAPGIPELQLDPERFHQILGYLLSNANRYSSANTTTTLHMVYLEGWLHIEVQDEGIGIHEADQDKIFEPFFRSDNPAVRELPGWGLSLHVAKLLATLMNGKIGFVSEPDRGSKFWFRIPAPA
jgi:signal transduction histidine kinase